MLDQILEPRFSHPEPPAADSLVAQTLRQFSGRPVLPNGTVSDKPGRIAPPTLAETMLRQRATSPRAHQVVAGAPLIGAAGASNVAGHHGRGPAWMRWAGIAAAVVVALAIAAAWLLEVRPTR